MFDMRRGEVIGLLGGAAAWPLLLHERSRPTECGASAYSRG
jgi:hypothetical protein